MSCDLKDKLQIVLITYNRCHQLERTFQQLLAENSPIRDFEITILDNNSTDKTQEVVEKYQKINPNIIYEKNLYNIGGNANIMKAFSKANKEYIWVLADNDYYCWDAWVDVEKSIEDGADAVVVTNYEYPEMDVAQLYIQTTFLPGVIYKTSNLDANVMYNMAFNISNMFPHCALSSKLINENKVFRILDKQIVYIGNNIDDDVANSYVRGTDKCSSHPLMTNMNWITGYANSTLMISDIKTRQYIQRHNLFYLSPIDSTKIFLKKSQEGKFSLYNYFCIFNALTWIGKLRFIINLILSCTLYLILFIYPDVKTFKEGDCEYYEKSYVIRLFMLLRKRILKTKIERKRRNH